MGRRQCRECLSTNIVHDGDTVACAECGSVLEQSQIVSEVTFGETSSGAATVQGSYVGADQAGARISGPGGFRGSSAGESRQQTLANALQNIRKMANIWNLSESVILMAHRIFTLAMVGGGEWLREHTDPSNFVLGRKSDITVASCLYLACRYENRPLMLIDFADSIGENVFTLGRSYLKLTRLIHMKPPRGVDGASTIVDPSIYIQRFSIMLDFGEETAKVTSDALRLIKRFKADWMVQGRRPAGICAAALILAARMNHFRRSVAEVVQVARIADVTLRKRLDEFAKTESSKLSVAEFRSLWLENAQDPPAFYEPIEAEKRKRLKIERLASEGAEDGQSEKKGRARKRQKVDKGKGKATATTEDDGADADDEEPLDPTDPDAIARLKSRATDRRAANGADIEEPETFEQALQRQRQADTEAAFDRMAEEDVAQLLRGPELRQTAEELEAEEAARIARAKAVPSAAAAAAVAVSLKEITMDAIDPRLRPETGNDEEGSTAKVDSRKDDRQDIGHKDGRTEKRDADSPQESPAAERPSSSTQQGPSDRGGSGDGPGDDDDDRASTTSSSSIEELDPTRIYFSRVRKRSMSAPIMPEDELAGLDEQELDMYIATDAEVKIKERVWIEFNRDYLERELNKQLKVELMEKQGIPAVKREQRKRKPRDSSTPMAPTAAEATRKMMQQNKKFSRKLNYDILNAMFDANQAESSKSQKGKQRGKGRQAPESEEDDDDEDQDDDDDEDGSHRALQLDGTTIDENGEVLHLPSASGRTRIVSGKSKRSRRHSGGRSRQSSVGGRSSGQETDGATTDGGDATDPMAAEYRRMVRGNMQADDGAFVDDEW